MNHLENEFIRGEIQWDFHTHAHRLPFDSPLDKMGAKLNCLTPIYMATKIRQLVNTNVLGLRCAYEFKYGIFVFPFHSLNFKKKTKNK